ncbi:MAG: hypothetical protein QM776_01670 [Rhodocyclaceae bacterium]
MNIGQVVAPAEPVELPSDIDSERQAYLDEAHVESTQFGVGRWDSYADAD